MTTEASEAKKIWDQIDAEETGKSPVIEREPDVRATEQSVEAETQIEDVDDPKLLREKIAGLESMFAQQRSVIDQLSGRVRNTEGHIGGLNSQLKQQIEAAKKIESVGGSAPTPTQLSEAQGDPQEMARLVRDYPDFAPAIKESLDSVRREIAEIKKLSNTRPQEQPQTDAVSREEMQKMRNEMSVEQRHPGWQKTVSTPEFYGWLESAPAEQKMLANSADPEHAVRLLDLFGESRKSKQASQQTTQRHQSAAALPTGQRSPIRTKNVDDMTPQEFWRYLDSTEKSKA